MPSRKRARTEADERVEVEEATSSLRHTIHKKSKLTRAAEDSGSVLSDGDSEAYGEDESQDQRMQDADASSEDDENDVMRATQIVEKQARQYKENAAAEFGIIEEVSCRNFMCHSKLRVPLGPLINFIIGHNGSGKSAVLTALTMCLGGKAAATQRGTSLKSMIKEGEESATLSVKIKNQGDDAFRPDVYGRSITVERHFSRAGTSGFKLKSAEDRVVSTKRTDLEEILDFFAFQLDNPINVLNQDMARQFLSNSTPADKYKFFIRGTQLEQLDKDYLLLEEYLDGMEAKLSSRQEDVHALEKNKDEAERKKSMLDRTRTIQEKIKQTQWMHAWAQVEEQERTLEACLAEVHTTEEKIEELSGTAEGRSGAYDGHNQSYEAAQRTATDLTAQIGPAQSAYNEVKTQFESNKGQLLNIQVQKRSIHGDMKDANKRIEDRETDIATERKRLAGAEGPERARKLDELSEAKTEAEQAKQRRFDHEATFGTLDRNRAQAGEEVKSATPGLAQQRDAIGKAENMLSRLQTDRGAQLGGYRNSMGNLIRAINNETSWGQKPVGPMGLHVRLLKPEWSSIIEKTFGSNLEAFVVTNQQDQVKLSSLQKRVNCVTPILIGHPEPMDTSHNEPDPRLDTIMRVLEIDNDLVRNQLIINQGIDQTVLIKDREETMQYMYGGARPRNCKATICFAAERGAGTRYDFARSGAEKSGPVQAWNGRPRMKTDIEAQIAQARENVRQTKQEADETQQRVRGLEEALKRAHQEIQRHKNKQSELVTQFQRAEDLVEEIKQQIEADRPQDGRLKELEDQLKKAQEDEQMALDSTDDAETAQKAVNESQKGLKKVMDERQKALDLAKKNVERAEAHAGEVGEQRRKALLEKNLALQTIEETKQKQTALADARDKQMEMVATFVTAAEGISRRIEVEPGMSATALDKRLEKFYGDIKRYEREAGGSREELTLAWQKAMQEFHDANEQLTSSYQFSQVIKRALVIRRTRWEKFRRYIAARAKAQFIYLISERKFRGRLSMDHNKKALDLKVEPDITKTSDTGRQAKTLSGGEKSFSTICLLLSIWEAMGSPIRCLDEFDVFMDSVNRAISMEMMIGAARRSVGRQFILITPQAMGNVELGDDVKVHKMSDPERGQTTLPFVS